MSVDIRRVAYAYNSALEAAGQPAYFLDCLVSRDGETVVDRRGQYKSKQELFDAMEGVIPLLEADVGTEGTSI